VKILNLKLTFLLFALFLVQASCIKKTIVVPENQRLLPTKDATHAQLLEFLTQRSEQIKSLAATVLLDLSKGGAKSGALDEYRQTRGSVVIDRPNHIRVQVQMPLVGTTVATMASDGQQYRLYIPIKNQFAIQDVNAPVDPKNSLSSLRPQIFLDGLFVDIRNYLNKVGVKPGFEEAVLGVHSYYVVQFFATEGSELQLLEKIWIDRTDLEVSRKQIFGKDGRLETDVEFQDYRREGDIPYPKSIMIRRPIEDLAVKLTFERTTMNQPLDAKVFDLQRPEGTEILKLNTVSGSETQRISDSEAQRR